MNAQIYTTSQDDLYSQAAGPQGSGPQGPKGRWSPSRIWAMVAGTVVVVALVAVSAFLLTGHSSTAPAGPSASTSAPANPAQPSTPGQPVSPAHPTTPVSPVHPSAAVMQLQRELGQLNYYEGPVDGIMGPQTTAAIKDLQRQAGLPQTGQMNAATQAALANYLAHGNNQMGGNS